MKPVRIQIWILCALAAAVIVFIQFSRKSSAPPPTLTEPVKPTIASATTETSPLQLHNKSAVETPTQLGQPTPLHPTNIPAGTTATSRADQDTETTRLRERIAELEQTLALLKSNAALNVASPREQTTNAIMDMTNLAATSWTGTNISAPPGGNIIHVILRQETSDLNPQPRLRMSIQDWPFDWREAPVDALPNAQQNGMIGIVVVNRPQLTYYILRQDNENLWLARFTPTANQPHKGIFLETLLTRVSP